MRKFASTFFRPSPLILLLAFCAFALAPLTAPGYFMAAHDARHSVYFLQMFDQSVRDGAWYPRWASDMVFGYGYPLWLILAPLPFFLGEAIHFVGFDFVSSVKAVDGLAFFFSALTMYLFASRVLGRNAGLIAGIAYAYMPYHLVDLYVRAAQAELVAFVFPPLVFWALHQLAATRQVRYGVFGAFGYAGLILSHIQSAVLFTPVIGLYVLFLALVALADDKRWSWRAAFRVMIDAAWSILLALGLAAIFLLPVIVEQKYLTPEPLIGGFFSYRTHFLNANQLLSPFWGYGYAGENGTDQFSLQLGLIPLLLTFVALWSLAKIRGSLRAHIALFALMTLGIVLLTLPVVRPLWDLFAGIVAYVQFPWRLLIITTFSLAFLAGAAPHALADESDNFAPTLAIALLFVLASYAYGVPQHTVAVFNYEAQMEFEVKDRELLGDTVWMMPGERPQDSPLVAQYKSGAKLERAVVIEGEANVETLGYGGQSVTARVQAATPARILFYTRYFPGWVGTIDEQMTTVMPEGEQGLIAVDVPAGEHVVRLRFEDTPARQIGALISAVSVIVALWLCNWATGRQRNGNG